MRLIALCAAFSVVAGPAAAGDVMVVKVRDLQLDTAAGAAVALERASTASLRFCRQASDLDSTILVCRRDMVGRFVRKLAARRVTLLHAWAANLPQYASIPPAAPWAQTRTQPGSGA